MRRRAKPPIGTVTRCSELGCRSPTFQNHESQIARASRADIKSRFCQEPDIASRVVFSIEEFEETIMGKGILLWLLGVPIPVIILLWLFFGR